MLSLLLYGLLAVVAAVGLFALAVRFLPAGEQIAPPLRDEPPWELPAGRSLSHEDIDAVRLPVALRGYRFAETDILLDRLAGELRARDDEIARLRGRATAPAEPPAPAEPTTPAGPEEPAEPVEPAPAEPLAADPDQVWAPPARRPSDDC